MKFAIAALIGATAAVRLEKDIPSKTHEFGEFGQKIPAEETVGHNNRDVLENFAEMYVQQPSQGGYELLGLDGWKWYQAITVGPETNYCTNANKATGVDQACMDTNNSAWNTHTSSVTKKPTKAQDAPYPDHPATTITTTSVTTNTTVTTTTV